MKVGKRRGEGGHVCDWRRGEREGDHVCGWGRGEGRGESRCDWGREGEGVTFMIREETGEGSPACEWGRGEGRESGVFMRKIRGVTCVIGKRE